MTTSNPELMTGLGAAASLLLSSAGSAFASAHSGLFAMRAPGYTAFLPIIISGVLAIYGIIVAVVLTGNLDTTKTAVEMTPAQGYKNLCAGLAVGFACFFSGWGIAKFMEIYMKTTVCGKDINHSSGANTEQSCPLLHADAGVLLSPSRSHPSLPPMGGRMFFVLVFLEAIGLYGLIVALILSNN